MATTAHPTIEASTPAELRRAIATDAWTNHTVGLAPGYTQANLVVLPKEYAYDFLLFCVHNPKPCPLLDVTDPGSPVPTFAAPEADLRSDLPRYRVYEHGQLVEEPTTIVHRWRDDSVAFLLGCSYTFEHALLRAGIRLRHVEQRTNVPMFRTAIPCIPAGRLHGPLVVSMRPIRADQVAHAVRVSSRYQRAHGAPVHIGDPEGLGIADLAQPDWGDPLSLKPGEVPVFWACGVTPQAVALTAKVPLMITHAPGHMFITDIPIEHLEA
ncbi:MAG: putative hydro-lyase [Thermomicrobiales bacterium]